MGLRERKLMDLGESKMMMRFTIIPSNIPLKTKSAPIPFFRRGVRGEVFPTFHYSNVPLIQHSRVQVN
jgi:hypothetical protein